ncbi:MAG: hypothetical protein AAF902_05920 [Chloroflexota bacterium]
METGAAKKKTLAFNQLSLIFGSSLSKPKKVGIQYWVIAKFAKRIAITVSSIIVKMLDHRL